MQDQRMVSIRSRKPVFVFTGQVRHSLNFSNEVSKLRNLIAAGQIERVVWASWESELSQAPEALVTAASEGWLTFVPTPVPTAQGPHPSATFQMAHLRKALEGLDDKTWVVKSRPDVVFPLPRIQAFLDPKVRLPTSPFVLQHWGLEQRLVVNWFNPAQFFTFCDLSFAGRAGDLRRILDLEIGDFARCSHNAACHFGNLAFPRRSEATQLWYDWLDAYYPGRLTQVMSASSGKFRAPLWRLLNQIIFTWPESYWAAVWKLLPDLSGIVFGWHTYLRFVVGGTHIPMLTTESRVGFADREYCADKWLPVFTLESPISSRPSHGVANSDTAYTYTAGKVKLDLQRMDFDQNGHIEESIYRDKKILQGAQMQFLVDNALSFARVKIGGLRKIKMRYKQRPPQASSIG